MMSLRNSPGYRSEIAGPRNRRPNPAGANLELIRCQGAAPGATVVSLGTIAIPAGAVEVDVVVPAGTVTIPLGNWTILCRRTTGGGGAWSFSFRMRADMRGIHARNEELSRIG